MKKISVLIISIFAVLTLIYPTNVSALNNNLISNNILIADKEITMDDINKWGDESNKEQTCDPDNSLLGDPENPKSVAWLLQKILNYIKIIGPILVVILSSIDFGKVIFAGDDDSMGKARKKLFYRLVLAALLFFIPVIVEALLGIFGLTSSATTCGIK